jgi:hypothetical protein
VTGAKSCFLIVSLIPGSLLSASMPPAARNQDDPGRGAENRLTRTCLPADARTRLQRVAKKTWPTSLSPP